jgi:hypothetical protein
VERPDRRLRPWDLFVLRAMRIAATMAEVGHSRLSRRSAGTGLTVIAAVLDEAEDPDAVLEREGVQ